MTGIKRKKCCNCKELFIPDPRNAKRQKYCHKPECRKASKAASQKRWLQKPENQDYFSGPENVKRVQLWREANPGYWRGKRKNNKDALQDPLNPQPIENKTDNVEFAHDALQDFLVAQSPVLLGLIANFTGNALQDNMVMTLQRLQKLGQDNVGLLGASTPVYDRKYGVVSQMGERFLLYRNANKKDLESGLRSLSCFRSETAMREELQKAVENGRTTAAKLVHHVVEIRDGGSATAWNNLQSLCNECHTKMHPNRFNKGGGG